MVNYTYSKLPTINFNTTPASVARSATGSVYAVGDTTYTTPLNMTLVVGGTVVTSISSDALGMLPDFTLLDRTSCVWKQTGASFATVLTTSDPVPGPQGNPGAQGNAGAQGVPGDVSTWKATTFYPLNTPVTNPSGDLVKVTTAHTSTSSYDATKFSTPYDAAVQTLVNTPGSATAVSLSATYAQAWKATTAYAAGQPVVNPSGDVVTAKVSFTSGASYNAANWNSSTTLAAKADVVPKWKAATSYTAGDVVISPTGETVSAKTSFTSGASYSQSNWSNSAAYATKRSNGRYDPTGKSNGVATALDTGEAILSFGSAPIAVASGVLTHTPFAGAGSAGYYQVTTTDPIERIGCEVRWQPGATIEQVAFVLPLTPWGGSPLVGAAAGIHFVIAGNGQWHCAHWTGSGEEAPSYATGRCADVRDGNWHALSIEITDRAAGKAVINLPDGSYAPMQSSRITTHTANNAVWELYETNGTGITTPANMRKLWVNDAVQVLDGTVSTAGQAIQAVNSLKRVVTEFTASGSGNVPASAVGAFVTLIAPGAGGGSGRRGAAATVRCGGGSGGGGGVINEQFIPISALSTSYSITLGTPGTGGAAVTANDTNGNAGVAAGITQFGSGSMALRALGGAGGGGGSTAAGAAGGAGAPLSISGTASSGTGGVGTNGSLSTTGAPGQAGAGGGITSADVAGAGGNGSSAYLWGNNSGGAGGVVDGAVPVSPALGIARQGDAPGGGAASITTAAQAGANALGYGCGGGGGGASLNGNNSGKGGDGGPGYARVTFVTL